MSPMLFALVCLVAVLVIMSIGDIVSTITKAFVPSVFVAAALFLAGFWQGWLPLDVVDKAQMGGMIANISMYLLIAHMGTLMSVRELCQEWKSVVIAVAGCALRCCMAALSSLTATLSSRGPRPCPAASSQPSS